MLSFVRKASLVLLLVVVACAAQPPPPVTPIIAVAVSPADEPREAPRAVVAQDDGDDALAPGDLGPIPVTSSDPSWGERKAPVTLVLFSDFQCPFCAKLTPVFEQLRTLYGPDKLRIVWKNAPLPFHPNARPAALAAETVFRLGGSAAFWTFYDLAFADQKSLGPEAYERWASTAGVDRGKWKAAFEAQSFAQKIDDDLALGKQIGVNGTPASFVNGVMVSGAQPLEKFRAAIDEQLATARALLVAGVPPGRLYARLSAENHAKVPPAPPASQPAPPDTTSWRVPIGTSPVRGKATAPVTLVMFTDFQCPFCQRVSPTVQKLLTEYGDDLRLVFKDNPLPFHPRAEPAAELAREARAQKGDAGYWKTVDLLWAQAGKLEDADLEGVAVAAGLNAGAAMRAVHAHKHKARIDEDLELGEDIEANGTPHFFINGRRLVGAQGIEKFREIIDEQLGVARAAVASGTPALKVYEALQKTAKGPPAPETKSVPVPTRKNPSRGPAGAKVTVQIFADFQCPFCKRANATLVELDAAFPGQLRFVWRNLPLSFHPQAELAAEAAMEAFAQRGPAGFWKMHDLLFENQGNPGGLERPALEQYAAAAGLDVGRFAAALDTGAHRDEVAADAKLANAAGISGTPGFMIKDYFVSGAQPLAKFRKRVLRALAETR